MYIKKSPLETALKVIEKMSTEQIEWMGDYITSEVVEEFQCIKKKCNLFETQLSN